MSNIDGDIEWSSLTTALRFAMRQYMKDVHTAIPGIVQFYSRATATATVRPAIDLRLTDGSVMPRKAISGVPVMMPGGGGWQMAFQLRRGDSVMLLFSERGISEWKRRLSRSAPDRGRMFAEADAVVLAGTFSRISCGVDSGICISDDSATNYLRLSSDGEFDLRTENAQIAFTQNGDVSIRGRNITITGAQVDFVQA